MDGWMDGWVLGVMVQVCEAVLAGELDRARAKYWRGVVLARINAKLIQDITSPKSSNVKAAASSS